MNKFSLSVWLRSAAIMSALMGVLYVPAIVKFNVPIHGLGPELAEVQLAAEKWGIVTMIGGIAIFAHTYLLNAFRSVRFRRIVLSIALIASILLAVSALPPLLMWLYASVAVFSWFSVLGFVVHLILFVLVLWTAMVNIYAFEKLRKP